LKEDQTKNIHAILSEKLEENNLKIEKLYLKKSKKNLII
jgi:hypothetical protein